MDEVQGFWSFVKAFHFTIVSNSLVVYNKQSIHLDDRGVRSWTGRAANTISV